MSHPALRRVTVLAGSLAAVATLAWAADALTDLGIPAAMAKEAIVSGVSNGYFNTDLGKKAMKAAPAAARGQLVTGAMGWAKTFAATPEFKASYEKVRQQRKPEGPPVFTGTPEEEYAKRQAQQKAEQDKNLAEMKAQLAQMPPETRKAVEEGMKAAAEMQSQMDTPEMRKMMIQGIAMERTQKKQQYDQDLAKWQSDYPENPRSLLVKRLQGFLDETKDVDFDAATVTKNGRKEFVKPEYENKSSNWKLAYRAGREAVTAARTAAQAWLTELQKSS